jgi:hypothetical protein
VVAMDGWYGTAYEKANDEQPIDELCHQETNDMSNNE